MRQILLYISCDFLQNWEHRDSFEIKYKKIHFFEFILREQKQQNRDEVQVKLES